MINRRRHAGYGNTHTALVPAEEPGALPQVLLPRMNGLKPEIFLSETGGGPAGSRIKWLISTVIAGAVGVGAIGIVMYASMNVEDGSGVVTSMTRAGLDALKPLRTNTISSDTLRVAGRKTDRFQVTSLGLSTKSIIEDLVVQERDRREFIGRKRFARIVVSLSMAQPNNTDDIPAFNPFKLYANLTPLSDGNANPNERGRRDVIVKVYELPGGLLPAEDGEELAISDVQDILADEADYFSNDLAEIRPAILPDVSEESSDRLEFKTAQSGAISGHEILAPRTTIIEKSSGEEKVLVEQREIKIVKVRRGDTISQILREVGAEKWQIKEIIDAMKQVLPKAQLHTGQELRFTLVPAPSDSGELEPIAVSLYSGDTHKMTIARNEGGDYYSSKEPVDLTVEEASAGRVYPQRATIYTSLYHAALGQDIPPDKILNILRIHSYDADFKRRVQHGDKFEVFFGLEEEGQDQDGTLGELLFTAFAVNGQSRRFYRFRTPDGIVDYYDQTGSSAKKFLMRKPVRGARFTSSFGYRKHPVHGKRKMHGGVDWAAKRGTPILAAGNGVVEAAGRKGGYGNYIRLRHANGYKTAFAHLHGFAKNLRVGMKVRQGQIIGYVGSTGYSTGPHLHYEVLVNNRRVNPMKIEVPRGRELKGRLLADFQKERARIDELMHRAPVKTRVAQADDVTQAK